MITPKSKYPLKILLADDGSKHSQAATALLSDLNLPRGSTIKALAVVDPREAQDEKTLTDFLEKTQSALKEKGENIEIEIQHGHPAAELIDSAHQFGPDLIVLGAKGLRATFGILLGGIAQQVVEYADWPVLVVRAPYKTLQKVLLAIDGSECSEYAVEYLARFVIPAGVETQVIHVLPPRPPADYVVRSWPLGAEALPPVPSQFDKESPDDQMQGEKEGQALLDQAVDTLRLAEIEASGVLRRGDAAEEIIDYVKTNEIDLVVTGSRGLSKVTGWLLGSVSRKLVHYAGCSVLIVKEVKQAE